MRQKLLILIFCISLLMLFSCARHSYTTDAGNTNIQKVRTYWEEVWNKGNLQAVADFYHPAAKHGEDFTIEGFQNGVKFQREAFPDFKATIIDVFATGDKVVSEVIYTGTHTGRKMFRQDPLGKAVKVPGLDVFTFKDGKCVSHQHVADHLDLVMQMGIKLQPFKDPTMLEQEVLKAGKEYNELMKRLKSGKPYDALVKSGDIAALDSLLAHEYIYTSWDGIASDKKESFEEYKNLKMNSYSADLLNQEVRVINNDAAVETGIVHYKGINNGKSFDITKRYTTTWAWRNGRWQIVADHTSGIETGHDKAQIEAEILSTNREFDKALEKKNREALSRFFADEYIYTLQDSRSNKEQLISFLVAPDDKTVEAKVEDRQFRVLDSRSAVETGKLTTVQIKNGKRKSESHYITVVWIHRDGRWQAVAEHWNKINEK